MVSFLHELIQCFPVFYGKQSNHKYLEQNQCAVSDLIKLDHKLSTNPKNPVVKAN
jgi:hypothetical protein